MVKEKIQKIKNEAKMLMVRTSLAAAALSTAMYTNAYATGAGGGDLGELLKTNLADISNRSINAVAVIVGIGALIKGAMAVKDMADSQGEGGPEQRDRGVKSLAAALGAGFAAAVLLGVKGIIVQFITTAMG